MKNSLAVCLGTLALGLACVRAHAGVETNSLLQLPPILPRSERPTTPPGQSKNHPERPERPSVVDSVLDVKEAIKALQEEKKNFLQEQKEKHKDLPSIAQEERSKIRDLIKGSRPDKNFLVQQVKESLEQAKALAREQARKLADEAKENVTRE